MAEDEQGLCLENIEEIKYIHENKEEKSIIFNGINNRYQMKKLISTKNEIKKRVITEKWELSNESYTWEKQVYFIKNIMEKEKEKEKEKENVKEEYEKIMEEELIIKEIERKIISYKHQDIEKKILEQENIIDLKTIVLSLNEVNIKCYYCECQMLVLYKNVREPTQWTVDRIDNKKGHNKDNFILSCLSCNLKRRCRSKENFLFTKQLNIIKKDNY
jgi:hypothetical protein